MRGVAGHEVLREWHEKRGLVCARDGKDPEYEAGWKRTAWARQVVVEEMVEEGKESRAAQKARHKRRKEERRRKRVALAALRAGGGSAAEVERWEKVLSEGWLERLWEVELLPGVELSGRDRGVGTCPPGVLEGERTSSVEEATVGPSGVAAEETAEAEPPREVSEAATTPRVVSEGREGEPSSVGTEQREARLSELTEGSADVSAWFGGLERKNLGWRSQEGGRELRRKVRHSSTGRRKVRRPVPYGRGSPMRAMMIWRRGRRSDFVWRERRSRKGGKKISVEGAGTDAVVPCGTGD